MLLFAAPARAIQQFDDPVFLGVVWRSVVWALAALVGLVALLVWGGHALLSDQGWLGWVAGALGGIGAAVLGVYFFLPLATVVALLFADRIAAAVERRCYPGLPPAYPAPLADQVWDGLALGLRVLVWQAAILVLLLIPPLAPVAAPLGWVVAAWAVGRGVFVAVAMRRMSRAEAGRLYRAVRPAVLGQGMLIALGSLVPVLNLFVPVLGTAALVHVLHQARTETGGQVKY